MYEKPVQPPPRMPTRIAEPGVPRLACWRLISLAAASVMRIIGPVTPSADLAGRGLLRPDFLAGAGFRLALGPLLLVVGDGRLDGVLGQHRAVDLDRRQVELLHQ